MDSGELDVGETIVMGIYDQMGLDIEDEEMTMLQFVVERVQSREGASMAEAPGEARKLLTRFEFPRLRWNER